MSDLACTSSLSETEVHFSWSLDVYKILFIYFSCAHLLLCLQVILKDVEDYEAQVMALETLVSSSQTNRIQFEKLCDEWKHLNIAVKVRGHSYKKCE